MKKLVLLLFIVICNIHYSQSQISNVAADKYLITGQLTNVPDGTKLSLFRENGQLLESVFRDTIFNGTFTFSDTISHTKKLLLISGENGFPSIWQNVWVAPGKHITVTGQDKLIYIWQVKSDIPEQLEENNFQNCASELRQEWVKHNVAETDWIKQMDSKENVGNDSIRRQILAKVDSVRKISFPLQRSIYKKEIDYMKTAPIGPVWMERLVLYSQMSTSKFFMPYLDELKELYSNMPEAMKHTPDAQLVYQYLYPPVAVGVGDEMADGELYDLQGTVHHLSEFKGKYILLDFWNVGCGPCIASIPELEEIAETYKNRLAVISINIDPEKPWKEFIAKKKMKGNQWNELRRANTGLAASYQVKGYPHYVLITPDGKVQDVWGGYGKGSLWEKMKNHLNKK